MCHPFAQPICENKSFEPDHLISSRHPIWEISNNDHQFFLRALSQKEDDFLGIINQVLKIKGIFEWFVFASKHLHHDIPTNGHLHHDIPIRRHLHHKTFASPSLWENIYIMFWIHVLASSWINLASPSWHGTSASWKLHLHPCQGALASKIMKKKSRFASCFVCVHRGLTSRSVVKSLSIAYWGTMVA